MHKLISLFSLLVVVLVAQPPQQRRAQAGQQQLQIPQASLNVQQQPAQTVTISLTSDLATALEKARVDIVKVTQNMDGTSTIAPAYPDLTSFLNYAMQDYFRRVLAQYPPATIKAAQDAAAKAAKDAQAAADAALKAK